MDDVSNARLDRIEQRLNDMPKAFATAFTLAFDNAKDALARQLDAFQQVVDQASDRRHGELLAQLRTQHTEQMQKFQEVIDEAIALREERLAKIEARLARLEAGSAQ